MQSFYGGRNPDVAEPDFNDLFMPVNDWDNEWHRNVWWRDGSYDVRSRPSPNNTQRYHHNNGSTWWSSSLHTWQESRDGSASGWHSQSYDYLTSETPACTHTFYGPGFAETLQSTGHASTRSDYVGEKRVSARHHEHTEMAPEFKFDSISRSLEARKNDAKSEYSHDDSSTDGSCTFPPRRRPARSRSQGCDRSATRQPFCREVIKHGRLPLHAELQPPPLSSCTSLFAYKPQRSKSRQRSISRKRKHFPSPQEAKLCSNCWRCADIGSACDDDKRWVCQSCVKRSMGKKILRCSRCTMLLDGLAPTDDSLTLCGNCASGGEHSVGNASLNTNVANRCYPCRSAAVISRISHQGFQVDMLGFRASEDFDEHISWADLQPVENPVVACDAASARLRFHCIDLKSLPSEWHSTRSNRWEIDLSADTPPLATHRWRTGHLEINLHCANAGSCFVQLAQPQCCGPQLLELGLGMHICLEHRREPVAAFYGGYFESSPPARGKLLYPSVVESWPDVESYVEAWRCLNFMEAVTNAVVENDTKILGGVSVKWTLEERCIGTFYISSELKDAHKLSIRADDLVCVRWQATPQMGSATQFTRDGLIKAIFEGLDSDLDSYLNKDELRAFAELTEFEGDADAWHEEFANLCQELDCDPSNGVDANAFARLVNDKSEKGCYCSDEELHKFASAFRDEQVAGCGRGNGSGPTWVAHALIESVEKFDEETQVQFRLHAAEAQRISPILMQSGIISDCAVELIPLAESYHYAKAAMRDLPESLPLVRDLILRGKVSKQSHVEGSSEVAAGIQDLVHFHFNESQEEAVRTALSEPVCLIHGPPGTGKTRTAAAVALIFARRNAQLSSKGCVLYAASGNRAVDVAADAISALCVERLEDLFQVHSAEDTVCCICWEVGCNAITFCGHVFHRRCLTQALKAAERRCPMCRSTLKSLDGIRLLRIYSSETERLEFPVPKKYDYQGVRERSRKAVPDEMRRFALHCRIHNKVPGHFNPHAEECATAYDALLAEGPTSDRFEAARARYRETSDKARAFELRSCNVLLTTNCSCRRSGVLQVLQKEGIELRQVIIDEAGTSPEPDALCPLTLSRHASHIVLVGDHRQLRPVVKNPDAEVLGLGRSLFERLSVNAEKNDESDSAHIHIAAAEEILPLRPVENRMELVSLAFHRLDVTGIGSLDCDLLRPFADFTGFDEGDGVWQDEYLKLCKELNCDPHMGLDFEAFHRLVDDRSDQGCFCEDSELRKLAQLSPVSYENSPKSGAPSGIHLHPPASVMLRQQYRMNPAINNFPSQQFYGGLVGNDISTVQRPAGCLVHPRTLKRSAVMLWESPPSFVEKVQEVASRDASVRSKANPLEAERCAQLASALAQRVGAKSVAVLSWYNAQVAELRQCLHSRAGCEGMHCGSVVTAQGSEWDYVLLSTVRNASSHDQLPRGKNAASALGCLADRHLLNVAVTRGRLGIVVFGSPRMLSLCKHWAAFVSHCDEVGGLVKADENPNLLVAAGALGVVEYSSSLERAERREAGTVTFQ